MSSGIIFASAQPVKDVQCYGEYIDVLLVDENTGEPKVPLKIPINVAPVVYGYGPNGEDVDPSQVCLKEPLQARRVYFNLEHRPPERSNFGVYFSAIMPRRFEISYGKGFSKYYYDSLQRDIDASIAKNMLTRLPNGFKKLSHGQADAGHYLAPDDHATPGGRPLAFRCVPMVSTTECAPAYWMAGDVVLRYWFLTDKIAVNQWLQLDVIMRRVVEELIADDYLARWEDSGGLH